ncbi:MAG: fumarate reductase subunit C [Candidatus Accumulibacter sp.]|jgi:fumarate reductase subunit C|nr:fumarate reductase subunit C [Accumulibacter sp.]
MSKRRPYVRSMDGWWKKNPYYVEYMVHEGTALFIIAYAIILTFGLVRLSQGPEAWAGWLEAMKSPLSIIFHLVLLAAIAYHAFTFFKLFPLTTPPVVLNGKKLEPCAIVCAGWTAGIGAAIVSFIIVWGLA